MLDLTCTVFSTVPFRGAEIVAQTTFTLSQESQNLQFEGYGFKLHVPEGSLPAEVSEAKLDVQVSLSGQFQMPPDCELISAVYWVYSPHKFTKPLTVEIQHCAVLPSDQQCLQLTFVSTKCTQKELPYLFKTRDGGVFSHHSSYGSLSLTQFSGVGVVKRKVARRSRRAQPYPPTSVQTTHDLPKQLAANTETSTLSTPSVGAVESLEIAGHDKEVFDQYCGQVYTRKGVNDCRVHFVITKNLDAHRTVSIPIIHVHTMLDGAIFQHPIFSQYRLWRFSIPGHHMSEKIPKWALDLTGKTFRYPFRGKVWSWRVAGKSFHFMIP